MKTLQKKPFLLLALMAGLGSVLESQLPAQTFTTLYNFTGGTDGAEPNGLILSGNTLYGTAYSGGMVGNCGYGPSGVGTVFALDTAGTTFTSLYVFTGCGDGGDPVGLILSGNTLYGSAAFGGNAGCCMALGTVFTLNADGTSFTTLYTFTPLDCSSGQCINSDGARCVGLTLSGETLYGAAGYGGPSGYGTVFSVNTNGSGFSVLHSFTTNLPYYTNSDGDEPSGLVLSGNTLYGTALFGGAWNNGTVFAINTDGTGFRVLHSFTAQSTSTNSEGSSPSAGLVLSNGTLYGTTAQGGSGGSGTVFSLNTDGTGFRVLHSFTATSFGQPFGNSDGANIRTGLILSGNTLYGTARAGGRFGNGTVFAVNTDGTSFVTLHTFTKSNPNGINIDGANPEAGLILSGNTLYGTASSGGSHNSGTIFSISLPISPPQLTIAASAGNVILNWATNATGFTLQSTTNLALSAVWITNSTAPIVVNGQNTVTNPISGKQQFYRLAQ